MNTNEELYTEELTCEVPNRLRVWCICQTCGESTYQPLVVNPENIEEATQTCAECGYTETVNTQETLEEAELV
jgi:ribosomal protein L37E